MQNLRFNLSLFILVLLMATFSGNCAYGFRYFYDFEHLSPYEACVIQAEMEHDAMIFEARDWRKEQLKGSTYTPDEVEALYRQQVERAKVIFNKKKFGCFKNPYAQLDF